MGTKPLSNNYLLWVESATPGTYNVVAGQGDLKISRSRTKIPLSDKTSAGYGLNGYGISDFSMTVDVQPVLPDANGYTRLESLCTAAVVAPFNVQIRKGGLTGATGDVVFAASVYGSITAQDMSENTPVKVSFEFGLAAAPTVDALAV